MRLSRNGNDARVVEIGRDGFSLRVGEEVLFLPYQEFPWFKSASEAAVRGVVTHNDAHLSWPALDIDLEVDAIRHPEQFPIVFEPDPQVK